MKTKRSLKVGAALSVAVISTMLSAAAAEVLTPCFLKLSLYEDIPGVAVQDLISDPSYPDSPSQVHYVRSFNTQDALPARAS